MASMNSTSIQGIDVFVEMGLCCLLLGESDKAMNYLGISPGSLRDPDPEVLRFVQVFNFNFILNFNYFLKKGKFKFRR